MSQTPAGWYVDAQGTTRWWDGTQWTEHTQPSASAPAAPAEPAAEPPAGAAEPPTEPLSEEADDRTRVRPAFRPPAESPAGDLSDAPAEAAADTTGQGVSIDKPEPPAAPVDDSPTYVGAVPPAFPEQPGAVPPPPGPPTGAPPSAWPTGSAAAPPPPGGPYGGPMAGPPGGPAGPPPGAPFGAPPWQPGPGGPGGPGRTKVQPWMLITGGGVIVVVIVVVVLLLVLSGGSKHAAAAPKDASVSDFCDSMSWIKSVQDEPTDKQLDQWQSEMRKVGTPSDMSADARKGWEKFVNAGSVSDVDHFDDDDPQLTAFTTYYQQNCM